MLFQMNGVSDTLGDILFFPVEISFGLQLSTKKVRGGADRVIMATVALGAARDETQRPKGSESYSGGQGVAYITLRIIGVMWAGV
ncbi:MAG: hypothetical protein VB027_02955 [Gordonibacter sp.]|nr:hypothetical protein [Gordonibacter sp.]